MNAANHDWEAPSSGVGSVGSDGFVAYYDVCTFMSQPGTQSVFSYESKVPYAFREKEWISYDNEQSVAYKVCPFGVFQERFKIMQFVKSCFSCSNS
jgi:GH18 family chitinase